MWLEDMITGDYTPYVLADLYRDVTWATTTPIHTGEQIYLRQNFKDLIDKRAVNIVGPDPEDVGGIAELKWIAEYADLQRDHDGAARRLRRADRAGGARAAWRRRCPTTTSPSSTRTAGRRGGTRS